MTINYQKKLEEIIDGMEEGQPKSLLLHSCCAPCSSYVLEYLANYFCITVFFYNPNIYPEAEYDKRVWEQQTLIQRLQVKHPISFKEGEYQRKDFLDFAAGLANAPEGGQRCVKCYELRLREAAKIAKEGQYDYFTTTLSISPMKNAACLNGIGCKIAEEVGVSYLPSDFKKKGGYQRSIALSKEFGLYRQDYCGCEFSLR